MPVFSSKFRAYLSHSEPITADQLIVKYDGVSRQVAKDVGGGYGNAGLIVDSGSLGLPFYIISEENNQTAVYTNSAGQHTIEISEYTPKIETTECFKKAVKSVSGGGVMMLNLIVDNITLSIEGATWQEAYDALTNGTMVYLKVNRRGVSYISPCVSFDEADIDFSSTVVNGDVFTDTYIWQQDGTVVYNTVTYPPQGN